MKIKKLRGLIAAVHTPFDRRGRLDTRPVPAQAETLLKQGVSGAYVSGTTGEGVSCSVEERAELFDAWAAAAKGRLTLIAHTGASALPDTRRLSARARAAGFDALSIVPPCFFKPASPAALVDYLRAALEDAGDLPFYYYHTAMSGIPFDMEEFLQAADGRIESLAGIKFNYPDLYMFQRCRRACGGRYDISWGIDEWFAGAVASGAESAVGSTYNYAAPLYLRIAAAVRAGRLDEAGEGMGRVCRIVDVLVKYGGVAAGKAMMAVHGLDLGGVRPPLTPLTPGQERDCRQSLEKIGFQ